jgi:hypothetical protein
VSFTIGCIVHLSLDRWTPEGARLSLCYIRIP